MKVLVTGFEKFGKEKINPSWEAIKDLKDPDFKDVKIIKKKLPVSFKKVVETLPEIIKEIKPDIYIAFGLAGGRNTFTIERVAINIMDSTAPDNEKYTPTDVPIFQDGPAAFFSTLPIKKIMKTLHNQGIPALISNTAGTYVCNTAFYVGRYVMEKISPKGLAGFIHIPFQSSQVVNRNVPSYPLDFIKKGVKISINTAVDYFKDKQ